jgi:hypothetical protein
VGLGGLKPFLFVGSWRLGCRRGTRARPQAPLRCRVNTRRGPWDPFGCAAGLGGGPRAPIAEPWEDCSWA